MEAYNPNEGEGEPMFYVSLERDVVWLMYICNLQDAGLQPRPSDFLGYFQGMPFFHKSARDAVESPDP